MIEKKINQRFVADPNLPKSEITAAVISGLHNKEYIKQYCDIFNNLEKQNIKLVKTTIQMGLANPVCYHPDMQCHHLGKSEIVVANSYLYSQLKAYGMSPMYCEKELKEKYPLNIALNAARIGQLLFAKQASLDNAILNYCRLNSIQIVSVKQGYCKCSTAIVNKNAIITSDSTIYKKALENNMQALKIRDGFIELPGYNYGFIGGACGLISPYKLAFAGDVTRHPDYLAIKTFLHSQKVEAICLHDGNLFDIGGILPIMEKCV